MCSNTENFQLARLLNDSQSRIHSCVTQCDASSTPSWSEALTMLATAKPNTHLPQDRYVDNALAYARKLRCAYPRSAGSSRLRSVKFRTHFGQWTLGSMRIHPASEVSRSTSGSTSAARPRGSRSQIAHEGPLSCEHVCTSLSCKPPLSCNTIYRQASGSLQS